MRGRAARTATLPVAAALALLAGCGGLAARGSDDERSRMLVRAGTAPTHRLPEEPDDEGSTLSAADAALVRAGTAPSGEATSRENPLDAEYRDAPPVQTLSGQASYYADSLAGNPTATGEPYDPQAYTCASRTLPFDTIVRVVRTDDETQRVIVRVNDRGPFGDASRLLDLSRAAAERLGTTHRGVAEVRVEVLVLGEGPPGTGRRRHRSRHGHGHAHRPRRGPR